MDEYNRRNPIPSILITLLLLGGGFYFFQNYKIAGLDRISVLPKTQQRGTELDEDGYSVSFPETTTFVSANNASADGVATPIDSNSQQQIKRNDSIFANLVNLSSSSNTPATTEQRRLKNIRIGSWALSGFGPSKLANDVARRNLIRVAGKFDVLALQQISSRQRDIVPRLVDALNESGRRYDFVLGAATGSSESPEHLAVIFDTAHVRVDRSQTYTVADPTGNMMYDPMVTLFRVANVPAKQAWTFSLVNVHIDLSRAAAEVVMLPSIFAAVRAAGRGEDDVVMAGLFQADDRYLIPKIMGQDADAAVRSVPTDIFNRHQTSNIIVHRGPTSEFIGRGGTFDFLRKYNLSIAEAESVSSHLPVFADFTPIEGGSL